MDEETNEQLDILDNEEPTPEELAEIEKAGYDQDDDDVSEFETGPADSAPLLRAGLRIKIVSNKSPKFKPKVQEQRGKSSTLHGRTKADKDRERREAAANARVAADVPDVMRSYMQEITTLPRVNKQQEAILAEAIQHGTDEEREDARATLIQANLRLVVKIAHDFKGYGLPMLDLISEGNIGLMRAVEKFDPAKGAKFSSYAAWWVKQGMRRAVANQSSTIRVPIQSASRLAKIKKAKMELTELLGRAPNDLEIARHVGMSVKAVTALLMSDLRTVSIHSPLKEGEVGELKDTIPDKNSSTPDKAMQDIEAVFRLMDHLDQLPDRDRMVLEMRFGLKGSRPLTLDEVSEKLGRTRERVRQIQNQALDRLKNMVDQDNPEECVSW